LGIEIEAERGLGCEQILHGQHRARFCWPHESLEDSLGGDLEAPEDVLLGNTVHLKGSFPFAQESFVMCGTLRLLHDHGGPGVGG
jgi:hypothetical protein